MKLVLPVLFLFLTLFTSLVNATPVFTKVAFPIYEVAFSNSEKVKEESAVKIGVQNYARSGISENSFSQKGTAGVGLLDIALRSKNEIKKLVEIVKKHDLFLIADEVYREFTYDGESHYSIMQESTIDQNAIMIDSVSKRYSMCGARIGCVVSKTKK